MNKTKSVKFQRLGKYNCRVLSLNGAIFGLIKKSKVGIYFYWVFIPANVKTFGDLCFTTRKIREIHDKVVECQKNNNVVIDEPNEYEYYLKEKKTS